jgi:hypothetical protein
MAGKGYNYADDYDDDWYDQEEYSEEDADEDPELAAAVKKAEEQKKAAKPSSKVLGCLSDVPTSVPETSRGSDNCMFSMRIVLLINDAIKVLKRLCVQGPISSSQSSSAALLGSSKQGGSQPATGGLRTAAAGASALAHLLCDPPPHASRPAPCGMSTAGPACSMHAMHCPFASALLFPDAVI